MATSKKNEAPTTAKPTKKPVAAGPKFTIEKLRANCVDLFGVTSSTFAGATYGMTGKYTVEEMKNHLESWKKKGVN